MGGELAHVHCVPGLIAGHSAYQQRDACGETKSPREAVNEWMGEIYLCSMND